MSYPKLSERTTERNNAYLHLYWAQQNFAGIEEICAQIDQNGLLSPEERVSLEKLYCLQDAEREWRRLEEREAMIMKMERERDAEKMHMMRERREQKVRMLQEACRAQYEQGER